jgi:TonB-dependent SusC/RagA subfamily outer membrane receptor
VLPEEESAAVGGQLGDYRLTTSSERDNRAYRLARSEEAREAYKAEQEQYENERKEAGTIYGEPDFVLRSKDFPSGSHDILEVMKGRVPGMNIQGDEIIIRGPSSIMGSNQPLFLIDGVPTRDIGSVRSIPVEEIDRVEVLKGANSAIFGMRGGNGVIAIYTKRGHFMKKGVVEFDMLGYHRPRIFYQPKYQPGSEPQHNYTLLWLPALVTDKLGKARIVFAKPQISGDYRFIIQGISYDGHVGSGEWLINSE